MKSTYKTASVLALAAAAVVTAGSAAAIAGDKRIKSMMRPGAGVSFDIGRSHAMSYFIADKGHCALTMVLSDVLGEDEMPTSAGTRLNATIESGKRARIDTPEGKSVEFICAPGATMVSLRKLDRAAYATVRAGG